ncbi:MAG: PQQ-binding-like beta-propeller repeat protein [Candidatus Eisenbacteria bacterium]|nr:PQQ-binding-like beta-propeller repeat protein [Candidatus Latescibacterota bacterium]MBD3302431.1 PQQ-binding-like beta-propeller repeat protein [Candidatus Eisenbacteria bacterium]
MELLMPPRRRCLAWFVAAVLVGAVASSGGAQVPRALWEDRLVKAPAVAPVISGDTLWVVGTDRKIQSHDARTGDRHWRRTLSAHVALPVSPGPDDLLLALGIPEPAIVRLDRSDGREIWSERMPRTPVGIARGESLVFVAAGDRVEAHRLEDGSPRWVRDLRVPLTGLAVAGSSLVVLGRHDSLWCLESAGGGNLWVEPVEGTHPSPPVRADTLILRLTYEGRLVRHDLETGILVDRTRVARLQIRPPAVAMGQIATAAVGGAVEIFDFPSLQRQWIDRRQDTIAAGASAWAGWWIVPTLTGRVFAITRDRGVTAWSLTFQEPLSLPPATTPDLLGLINDRGRIVVYTLEESM